MTFGEFLALMMIPRLVFPHHPLVFRNTLKDMQKSENLDSPEKECEIYITFRIFFHTDHEFEVGFGPCPSSLHENAV